MSNEHLISKTVLTALGGDKVRVEGMPWMKGSEPRVIGINSLVSKCLCEAHNNALSDLDNMAGRFYRTLENCLLDEKMQPGIHLFSGHDIERWLLKVTVGLAVSKALAAQNEVLPGIFVEGVDIANLVQELSGWNTPMGVYVLQKHGDFIKPKGEFNVAPLASDEKEIGGLLTQMLGFTVALFLKRGQSIKGSLLEHAVYRIEKLNFNQPNGLRQIQLSWVSRYS